MSFSFWFCECVSSLCMGLQNVLHVYLGRKFLKKSGGRTFLLKVSFFSPRALPTPDFHLLLGPVVQVLLSNDALTMYGATKRVTCLPGPKILEKSSRRHSPPRGSLLTSISHGPPPKSTSRRLAART